MSTCHSTPKRRTTPPPCCYKCNRHWSVSRYHVAIKCSHGGKLQSSRRTAKMIAIGSCLSNMQGNAMAMAMPLQAAPELATTKRHAMLKCIALKHHKRCNSIFNHRFLVMRAPPVTEVLNGHRPALPYTVRVQLICEDNQHSNTVQQPTSTPRQMAVS